MGTIGLYIYMNTKQQIKVCTMNNQNILSNPNIINKKRNRIESKHHQNKKDPAHSSQYIHQHDGYGQPTYIHKFDKHLKIFLKLLLLEHHHKKED
ncbi:unnamed protein product [Arctia plantaginis]|uniref:Uncharacterized protein n=1 Tax=Arctia plantaginis TaxID=874455 RepID=A0A8S1A4G4_ARCPL|nr:unnamed protein product [Arctia plantaginis]